jgi:hypothetical protein
MALTVETIRATDDEGTLVDLLSEEARRLLPDELFLDTDKYYESLDNVPRGIRAMAGVYPFFVSMQMDDLAWHFTNHPDERHICETLNGLRELELPEIADLFERASGIIQPYLADLHPGRFKDQPFYKWAKDTGIKDQVDPWNKVIWAKQSELALGLLTSWAAYARKYPERCVVTEAQA